MLDARRDTRAQAGCSTGVPQVKPPDVETSSAGYARRFSGRAGRYLLQIQEEALMRALRDCPPGRVLDVGGAHGQLVDSLRSLGWSVTVLGSSEECGYNLRVLHGKRDCEFVCSDILHLSFPDASFELVTSVRLLSHVEDWEGFLGELCRVSARWIVIDYPSTSGVNALTPLLFKAKKRLEGNTRTYRSFSARELDRVLSSHGYRKGAISKQFVLPMALHRVCGSAAPLRLAESVSRAIGLTAIAGSPVMLRADRATGSALRHLECPAAAAGHPESPSNSSPNSSIPASSSAAPR